MLRFNSPLKTIARDWRIKNFFQKVIGVLPKSIGFRLNEFIVRSIRGNVEGRTSSKKRILKALNNMEMLSRETGFSFSGKSILELGTGWHGIDLLIFYLLGTRKIITIDQFKHLSLANLIMQISYFEEPECLARLKQLNYSEKRLRDLRELKLQASSLEEFLERLGINYLIIHSSKYKELPLKSNSIDLFYSESVLQRIPQKHLKELINVVGNRLMTNEAVSFHRTDQKDINAQKHVDSNLWSLNYLKYNDWFFSWFLSSKFNSQNRLRESDFLLLFQTMGISNIYVESFYRQVDVSSQ